MQQPESVKDMGVLLHGSQSEQYVASIDDMHAIG